MCKIDPKIKEEILIKYHKRLPSFIDEIDYYCDHQAGNIIDHEMFPIPPIFFQNHPKLAQKLQEKCNYDLNEFRNFINNKLNELNISQNELAERSLMPKQTLSNKMQRKSKFTIEQALALSLGMELTIDELHKFLSIIGFNTRNPSVILVESCIDEGINNIISVNDLLYDLNLPLLGSIK